MADALFANGVNQIIWHGMPFNPIGLDTNVFYATVHVGTKGNLSKDLKNFNEYLEKLSSFMKRGVTYSDVAVYLPLEDVWMGQGIDEPDPQMPWAWGEYEMRSIKTPSELKGYHPLWINADFLGRAELVDGKLLVGDCSFSSLYVDVNYIDIDTLKIILNLATKGFPVCVKNIPEQAGKNKSSDFDNKILKLLSLNNVSELFSDIAVSKPLIEGEDLPDFWCRIDNDELYMFLANPCSQGLKLPLEYDLASACEPVTKNIIINLDNKSLELTLEFEENQSILLVIDKNGKYRFINITFMENLKDEKRFAGLQ